MEIIGSGGYGMVVSSGNEVFKLFYDINGCSEMLYESDIQEKLREIMLNLNNKEKNNMNFLGINIPKIFKVYNKTISLKLDIPYPNKKQSFLCGILMERIIPPKIDGFPKNEQIHIGLGLKVDCNQSWICENGITRGFYSNTEMLETIINEYKTENKIFGLESENEVEKFMTKLSYTLGKVYREAFDSGYKLFDVEIVLGVSDSKNLTINMIDFGKVIKFKSSTNFQNLITKPEDYYYDTSYMGLVSDSYVPHKNRNDKYWENFYEGFFIEI
jgi:hypothetical protein